jgi:hypothetical protein
VSEAVGTPSAVLMGRIFGPQLLKVVKASYLRAKDVDDHITRIDQHPVTLRHALDAEIFLTHPPELFGHLVGDGVDVAVGAARCYDHRIGHGRFIDQIDGDDLLGFRITKLIKDRLNQWRVGGLGRHRPDGYCFRGGFLAPCFFGRRALHCGNLARCLLRCLLVGFSRWLFRRLANLLRGGLARGLCSLGLDGLLSDRSLLGL